MAHSPASIRRLPLCFYLRPAIVIVIAAVNTGASAQLLPDETSTLVEGTSTPAPPSSGGGEFGTATVVGDFNGDGIDDLAAGQDVGPGRVHVFSGGAAGPQFQQTLLDLNSDTEDFGLALAACDLNDDGHDDLIVGAPGSTVNGNPSAGNLFVYLGGSLTLTPTQAIDQNDLDDSEFDYTAESSDRFGAALTTGDFDGDGWCDVAVSSTGEDRVSLRGTEVNSAGMVTVLWGLGTGLLDTNGQATIDLTTVGSSADFSDEFGDALLTVPAPVSDVLIAAASEKDSAGVNNAGLVWVIPFSGRAVQIGAVASLDLATLDTPPTTGSRFGSALAAIDTISQGPALAVGAPDYADQGAVFIAPLDQLTDADNWLLLDQSDATGGVPQQFEDFGAALTVGNFNGDLWQDLVVGAPRDTVTVRGGPSTDFGRVHVFYGGISFPASDQSFVDTDLGLDLESDGLGQTLAAGDLFGRGADALAISAPDRDDPNSRGLSDNQNWGVVHVVPPRTRFVDVEVVARTGLPIAGDPRVVQSVGSAAAGGLGQVGFRGIWDDFETFVGEGGSLLFQSSSLPGLFGDDERGLALAGSGVFGIEETVLIPNRGGIGTFKDALVTSSGLLITGGQAIPETSDFVGELNGIVATEADGGRIFVLSRGDTLDSDHILGTGNGGTGPVESVLGSGDPFDGAFVKSIEGFDLSASGNHRIFHGVWGDIGEVYGLSIDDSAAVVRDFDSLFGDPTFLTFGDVAIDDTGAFLFSAALIDGSTRVYGGEAESVSSRLGFASDPIGQAEQALGVPQLSPLAVSVRSPVRLTLWTDLPTLGNRGFNPAPDLTDVLFQSCSAQISTSQVALRSGNRLALDGSALADATLKRIYPVTSTEGLEVTDDQRVHLHVQIEQGSETFDAIVAVPLIDCPFFRDGFETGDTTSWSLTTP